MYNNEKEYLEQLLLEFGLTDAISSIEITDSRDDNSATLVCIVKKGSSVKIIATVFNEYDYFPKYSVIRERFKEKFSNVDVRYLI